MKKISLILFVCFLSIKAFSQVSWQGGSNPDATASATILFDKSTTPLSAYSGTIYAHTGVTLNGTAWSNVIGSWGNNTTQPALTLVSGNIYKLDLTPTLLAFYGSPTGAITKVNIVFRNALGTAQSADLTLNVGAFQSTLVTPSENSNTILNSGGSLSITANNTNGNASYNLYANGVSINTATGTSYSYTDSNITVNKSYDLQITQGTTVFSKKFSVIVNAGTTIQTMASGLEDGINYNASDATRATLVLTAPGKDFVYVAGSFNNWVPGTNYLMRYDNVANKFWLELTGLTPGTQYSYQYWVVDQTPTTNSQAVVKVADPYSTLVLSPYDDPYIPAASYPNMPTYPAGQQFEVTVLQTGQTPYNWSSATTGFVKPSKDNLVVYEVLIRDFDANRTFQDLINRIDYFKNLKINAIELMPVMEFEGDEGWGYNPAFHLALDKYYGTKAKMQEFVDLCHQNGIAVILDVALNHAFGRNPMVRMWQVDPTNSGYGAPATDNPYFNTVAKHSYGVGNDFNHASAYTKYYVKRVIKQWVQEFKIDGFRWDLTKGFTQACSSGDDACTNGYQQDRVDILKDYADYSWSLDPNHYVIFEHLGIDSEEQQWANYRIGETPSKGVMMWSEMTYAYSQLIEGYATGGDISRVGSDAHGFTAKRAMGYPESHDKDRLMYSAMTYGNGGGTNPVNGNLNNSLARMSAIGAISLLVPGPKMIWHFADLGMNNSIYMCTDGTVNTETDTTTGDCKLATKPQPQWTNNWPAVTQRAKIYSDWAKMIDLKTHNQVFSGSYAISPDSNNVRQRVYVYDNSLPSSQLKNVVILANFSVASQNVIPDFPYTGTWVNLMDNSTINVTSTSATIAIEAGGFRIYGNQSALTTDGFVNSLNAIALYPNPSSSNFSLTGNFEKVLVYSMTGQLVKTFTNTTEDYQYPISDLNSGMYLVKAIDSNNNEKTLKLIKQ
ncbi:alpha-amylase family glycosyl hydrolase [Flavobacterium sp. SUN046]|uniref:alpha-amylase family glycosyl hydrolase n=1 Tax=Flavobacterium sp. SUN046 TaxID=3002440 RepID=UPI002DB57315|nr:alpha-amylase family glycosyl hydrolase [Flavobacterium sp. SUN046]MEC4049168.1 alpha-amylase family glycosyl hydrolase [Flavobacterium sp. SUN046]